LHLGRGQFAAFSEQILDSLKRVPGIVEAGATTMPLLSFGPGADLMIQGEAASEKKPGHAVEMQVVTPGYFSALGTTLLRGRFFSPADDRGRENVVLVNEAAAGLFEKNPMGMHVRLSENDNWRAVVGIVGNTRSMFYNKVAWETRPRVFIPLRQAAAAKSFGPVGHELFVYVQGRNLPSSADLRQAVSSVDSTVAVSKIEPLEHEVDVSSTTQASDQRCLAPLGSSHSRSRRSESMGSCPSPLFSVHARLASAWRWARNRARSLEACWGRASY
jgi:hypothetical protein